MVDIRTLGTAAISLDGDRRIGLVGHPDAFALFVLIALEGPVDRAELRRLLASARADNGPRDIPTLDQLLDVIDSSLGYGSIADVEGRIQLAPHIDVRIDAARFDAALERGDLPSASRAYGGSFLAGLPPPSLDGLKRWVEATRERYAEAFAATAPVGAGSDRFGSRSLQTSASRHPPLADPPRSRMERLMDRVRGRLTYQVAAFYVVAAWAGLQVVDMLVDRNILGDFAFRAALVVAILGMPVVVIFAWARDEEGVSLGDYPDTRGPWPRWIPRTRTGHTLVALSVAFVVLLTAFFVLRETLPEPVASAGPADPSRLAVLYFDDHSPGQDLRAEAAGFTSDLITQLQAVPTLDVRSRNAVKPFREGDVPQDSIFAWLDVGSLVEGALTRSGDSLRVSVSLVAATDSGPRVLDSRDVYGVAGSELALGADLVAEVARILREKLGVEIRLRELQRETGSDEAWLLVQHALEAREEARRQSFANRSAAARYLTRADSLLAKAEEVDADWVDPVIERAWTAEQRALLETDFAGNYDEAWGREALEYAERAVAMAPENPAALELRGKVRYGLAEVASAAETEELLLGAERDLIAALGAEPARPRAAWALSRVYRRLDRREEAARYARLALDSDYYFEEAQDAVITLYTVAMDLRRPEQAEHYCSEGRRRWPDGARWYQCGILLMKSYHGADSADLERAAAWADSFVALADEARSDFHRRYTTMLLAGVAAMAQMPDSARVLMARAQAPEPLPILSYDEAHTWILLGEPDSALDRLETWVDYRPAARMSLGTDWYFESLFDRERFQRITGERGDR